MSRRRLTWIIHNALMTPLIPIRVVLFAIFRVGKGAEWLLSRTPGWRMFDGWGGW